MKKIYIALLVLLGVAGGTKFFVYSINDEDIIFEDIGRLLFTISNETKNIYYSKDDKILCIDFSKNIKNIRKAT